MAVVVVLVVAEVLEPVPATQQLLKFLIPILKVKPILNRMLYRLCWTGSDPLSPSDFARKRKTAANPPPRGKRKSRGAVDLKKIKPEQRVRDYPSEPLTVSNGKLFCRGCREELCLKSSSIKNHLKSNKHQEGKVKLSKKEAREKDIAEALVQYNSDNHLRGETLPQSQQVYRVKVVKTFLQAGVPLSKLNIFRDLLEENGYRLSDRRFMFDLIPFILKEEEEKLKEELSI